MAYFEFKQGDYVALVVFIEAPDRVVAKERFDILGAVWWDGSVWKMRYRFRYDAETGDDNDDRKSGYGGELKYTREQEDEIVASSLNAFEMIKAAAGPNARLTALYPKSDSPEEVWGLIMTQPWCHMQSIMGTNQTTPEA